ncbi:MAG: hypothetical protein ACKV1O_10495 [Saprospiraceae bacterium]
MTEKETIRELVSNGHTAEALDKLLSMDLSPKDRSIVAQIKASFENLRRNTIKGILSYEQQTTEQNRINDRLLRFLNGETEQLPVTPMAEKYRRKVWRFVVGAGVVVGILVGIFQIAGISLKEFFGGGGSPESFTVTVFVHGKKGKDDRILKNQGQVMLGLRTSEMPCNINEKGEATFKEIPMGFKGKRVPIRIEHPQPYRATHPDSLYLLEPNAAIFVEVALEGTNVIKGKVMDFNTEQWLDSVRVSVENVATYTDQFGWFELEIPENKQRKFQRVSFFKKGFEINELDSIPVHTQQEINSSLRKSKR